jgi:hypothetical protein
MILSLKIAHIPDIKILKSSKIKISIAVKKLWLHHKQKIITESKKKKIPKLCKLLANLSMCSTTSQPATEFLDIHHISACYIIFG